MPAWKLLLKVPIEVLLKVLPIVPTGVLPNAHNIACLSVVQDW